MEAPERGHQLDQGPICRLTKEGQADTSHTQSWEMAGARLVILVQSLCSQTEYPDPLCQGGTYHATLSKGGNPVSKLNEEKKSHSLISQHASSR